MAETASRRWDSNPRPELYKSPALPTELLRRGAHGTPPTGSAPQTSSCLEAGAAYPNLIRTPSKILRIRLGLALPFLLFQVRLRENLATLLMREDLALHPLQRVVDRLRVAPELVGHLLVRRSLEVQAQRVGLER